MPTRRRNSSWASPARTSIANAFLALALVQLLQIVGESASRVSPARCAAHPEIPWAQIVALRNRLIHGYDTIDLDIVWSILTQDITKLIADLERITSLSTP